MVAIPAGGDAKNGPIPQRDTRVVWIAGTTTAQIYFHVKAWVVEFVPMPSNPVGGLPHVVLSNRFRVTSTTDNDYYSRRHVAGQMIIDPSKLALFAGTPAGAGVLTPDNFRNAAFLQIPLRFKCENIQVTVCSDNTTLDYSYIDQETPLSLGPRSLATEIEAFATCGITDTLGKVSGLTGMMAAGAAYAGNNLFPAGLTAGLMGLGGMAPFMPAGMGAALGHAPLASGDLGGLTTWPPSTANISGRLVSNGSPRRSGPPPVAPPVASRYGTRPTPRSSPLPGC